MSPDTRHDLANDLRRMADLVEALPVGTTLSPKVNVYFHNIHSLEELQAATRGCASIRQHSSPKVGPWIDGYFGSIEVSAFYRAGILGKTRKKTVTIIESEVSVDLSLLG